MVAWAGLRLGVGVVVVALERRARVERRRVWVKSIVAVMEIEIVCYSRVAYTW